MDNTDGTMTLNKKKLILKALIRFGLGFAIIGLILFLCAGSLLYINGWVFILALVTPMIIFGVALLLKDPTVDI
jgi:amino acid transporter